MRQRRRHCTITVLAATLLGACTTTTEIGGGASATGSAAPSPTDGGSGLPMSAEACALSRDSLEVAADAYMAVHGEYPETTQQMLEANLLMSAPDSAWTYTYAPGDRDYVITAVAGGPCD